MYIKNTVLMRFNSNKIRAKWNGGFFFFLKRNNLVEKNSTLSSVLRVCRVVTIGTTFASSGHRVRDELLLGQHEPYAVP